MTKEYYQDYSKKELFGFWFWLHLFLDLLFLSSPFWLSWKIILVMVALMFLQFLFLGKCVLNKAQFKKTKDAVFLYPYLKMLGWRLNYKTSKILLRYIVPICIVIWAYIWQAIIR